MTEEIAFQQICDIVRKNFPKAAEVRPLDNFREVIATDSLEQLTLVVELENQFQVTLAEDFAQDLVTVEDLARALCLETAKT